MLSIVGLLHSTYLQIWYLVFISICSTLVHGYVCFPWGLFTTPLNGIFLLIFTTLSLLVTPCSRTTFGCLNWASIAASWSSFTLPDIASFMHAAFMETSNVASSLFLQLLLTGWDLNCPNQSLDGALQVYSYRRLIAILPQLRLLVPYFYSRILTWCP